MASRIISNRCAACGRPGRALFTFVVLAEVCKKYGIKLNVPSSPHFHERCARRANAAVKKKAPPLPAEVTPFIEALAELLAEDVLRKSNERGTK